jgi:ABC-2 type transport system permease protein
MTTAAVGARSRLRDIRGPSAVGGGGRRFLDLLWLIASTSFRLTYHGTVLGFVWSLIRPLLLFGILLAVFTQVFRLGDSVPHYAALLLLNVMLFGLFSESTTESVQSVLSNEALVRKMQFPRLVIPLSVVLTKTLQFALNLVVVAVIIVATGVDPVWTWLLFPIVIAALLVLTTAVSMLLSASYVRLRDVAIIWTVVASVLFYATPILYTVDFPGIPQVMRDLISLNPLTPIFNQAREWIIDPNAPGAVEAAHGNALLVVVPAVLFVAICVLGVWVFNREAPRVAEEL